MIFKGFLLEQIKNFFWTQDSDFNDKYLNGYTKRWYTKYKVLQRNLWMADTGS